MVTGLDRLGRALEHLIELSYQQQTAGVDLVVLDQGIDTSTAVIPVLVDGAAMPALTGA